MRLSWAVTNWVKYSLFAVQVLLIVPILFFFCKRNPFTVSTSRLPETSIDNFLFSCFEFERSYAAAQAQFKHVERAPASFLAGNQDLPTAIRALFLWYRDHYKYIQNAKQVDDRNINDVVAVVCCVTVDIQTLYRNKTEQGLPSMDRRDGLQEPFWPLLEQLTREVFPAFVDMAKRYWHWSFASPRVDAIPAGATPPPRGEHYRWNRILDRADRQQRGPRRDEGEQTQSQRPTEKASETSAPHRAEARANRSEPVRNPSSTSPSREGRQAETANKSSERNADSNAAPSERSARSERPERSSPGPGPGQGHGQGQSQVKERSADRRPRRQSAANEDADSSAHSVDAIAIQGHDDNEEVALADVAEAIDRLERNPDLREIELRPTNSFFRRLQHSAVAKAGFVSESFGEGSQRALKVVRPSN